jgi:hypothetical protein
MNPEALDAELSSEPFIPLRLNLSDGTHIDVFNPSLAFINHLSVYVATDPRTRSRLVGDMRLISLRHIVSVDQLRPPQSNRRRRAS